MRCEPASNVGTILSHWTTLGNQAVAAGENRTTQQFCSFRSEADVNRQAKSADSVEIDPLRTSAEGAHGSVSVVFRPRHLPGTQRRCSKGLPTVGVLPPFPIRPKGI